jgi:CheY-like chemotaxis protein
LKNKNKPRVLIAAAPHSLAFIARPLEKDFELVFAATLSEARSIVGPKIDLIVCGLYFDESRMFDLLRYVKADPDTRSIPFVSVKATGDDLSRTILQGIEIACKALGAHQFVELSGWEREYGESEAHARYQQLVRQLTLSQGES